MGDRTIHCCPVCGTDIFGDVTTCGRLDCEAQYARDMTPVHPIGVGKEWRELFLRLDRIERMLGVGQVRTVTETQIQNRRLVLEALEDGATTIKGICKHAQIARQRVCEALAMLEAEERIVVTRGVPNNGRGRPGNRYALSHANLAANPQNEIPANERGWK